MNYSFPCAPRKSPSASPHLPKDGRGDAGRKPAPLTLIMLANAGYLSAAAERSGLGASRRSRRAALVLEPRGSPGPRVRLRRRAGTSGPADPSAGDAGAAAAAAAAPAAAAAVDAAAA